MTHYNSLESGRFDRSPVAMRRAISLRYPNVPPAERQVSNSFIRGSNGNTRRRLVPSDYSAGSENSRPRRKAARRHGLCPTVRRRISGGCDVPGPRFPPDRMVPA